jgi:hypothetical protein
MSAAGLEAQLASSPELDATVVIGTRPRRPPAAG